MEKAASKFQPFNRAIYSKEPSLIKIQRTIPPAAAPVGWRDVWHGAVSSLSGEKNLRTREKEFREYFGIKNVFFVSSGKAALYLILKGLRSLEPEKDEVIVSAYTCYSVPSAVVKAGLKVVPCDMELGTFDFNKDCLRETISNKTLCVVCGHLLGIPSDMNSITALFAQRGVAIIEDAAQAMGGRYKGRKLGTIGDAAFFSFGRGKNITCGYGGVIITNSDALAAVLRNAYISIPLPSLCEDLKDLLKLIIMLIFIKPSLFWFPSALPFLKLGETFFYKDFPVKKLSRMKAGILKNWQKRLEQSNDIHIRNTRFICNLSGVRPAVISSENIAYLRVPLLLKDKEERDNIFSDSKKNGLGISCLYPSPINEIKEIKEQMKDKVFPVAKKISDTLINIPTHQLLTNKDKERICIFLSKSAKALL